jgi:hypothetical protein
VYSSKRINFCAWEPHRRTQGGGGAGGAGAPQPVAEKKFAGRLVITVRENPIQLNYWLRSVADSNT